MKIEIFDVDHGQCAVLTAPNGRRIMIDCGTKTRDQPYWWPHLHYYSEQIDLLALTNLDEDHVANFGDLLAYTKVQRILSNPSIGAAELKALKVDGMGVGTAAVYNWMRNPERLIPRPETDFGGVYARWFCPDYVPGITTSTNDLSVVLIVQYGNFKIAFTGDMEVGGWKKLLARPDFIAAMAGVNVFLASHHGRESGCSTELFDKFKPEIVIISDHEQIYDSQDTNAWYRQRCKGIPMLNNPSQRRYVYTTNNDGSLQIDVASMGSWTIQSIKVPMYPSSAASRL